ncbi:MAG: NAD-dependent protein deacylase [Miltoncostaeaceae bacterium]
MDDTPQDLARLLGEAEHAIALTGAGMSTESGIPDFRSPGGVWEKHDPTVVGSLSVFLSQPELFWQFHRPRIDMIASVDPNPAHHAIAALERSGHLRAVVTQNIDRLHARAGSRDLIEVHGSLDRGHCLRCESDLTLEETVRRADAAEDGVPRCECGFQLKTGVVQFGEALPASAIQAAHDHALRADLILVVGSSLAVSPVNQMAQMVVDGGGRLAILTEGDTPFDDIASVRLRGRAGVQLTEVVQALGI